MAGQAKRSGFLPTIHGNIQVQGSFRREEIEQGALPAWQSGFFPPNLSCFDNLGLPFFISRLGL